MGCQYEKCCCCINLRVGSLIIGYFHLIAGILTGAGATVIFINGLQHSKDNVLKGFLGANMVFSFISVLFVISLLIGIHKYQYRYIQPYLMYNALFVGFYVVYIGLLAAWSLTANIPNLISTVISLIITIYFLLIIRSYCLELKRQGNPMAPAQVHVYSAPAGSTVVYQPTSTRIA